MELGMSGIGLYWCIIECLYENNGYFELEQLDLLAYELRVDKNLIENLIDNYDLFKKNKKCFFSKSVLQRLEKINEISKKNKENARKRWDKKTSKNTLPTNSDSNATALRLEYKEKENKNKKKIKENIIITTTNIFEYIESNFGRTLSPIEFEKINNWLLVFKEEVIEYAVKIAVMNCKKTFSYVEGILKTWKGKNLETLNQIMEEQQQFERLKHKQENSNEKIEIFDYDWLNTEE